MRAEFYQHDQHWSNRMILGDSLQVMASLAERERLKGKVQCIYFDPPYGIKFNSNWQVSTRTRDVKDGKPDRHQPRARAGEGVPRHLEGRHPLLSDLSARSADVARDLLTESGSIFVQIGDENVHRVRAVMDEVFGSGEFCCMIRLRENERSATERLVAIVLIIILWYAKSSGERQISTTVQSKDAEEEDDGLIACMNRCLRWRIDLATMSGDENSRGVPE